MATNNDNLYISTKKATIRIIANIVIALAIFDYALFIPTVQSYLPILLTLNTFIVIIGIVARLIADRNPQVAVFTILIMADVVITILFFGANSKNRDTILAGFVLVPILSGLLGLSLRKSIIMSLLTLANLIIDFVIFTNINFHYPFSDWPMAYLIDWIMIFCLSMLATIAFVRTNMTSWQTIQNQNLNLQELSDKLLQTNQSGANLSVDLANVTNNLTATSKKQRSASEEQSAAVTQVTATMEELNNNASAISNNTEQVVLLAENTLELATKVQEISHNARTTAQTGRNAAEQTIQSVSKMSEHIGLMATRLTELTEQANTVSKIVDTISDIASETHLLALNASIEAQAGTGTIDNRRDNQANRFEVIAQEVKALSDRSSAAAKRMKRDIEQMQSALTAVIETTEAERSETFLALERSQIAGAVIGRLTQLVELNHNQASQILTANSNVKTLCDEINLAIRQQRSAYEQTFGSMKEIDKILQQGHVEIDRLNAMATTVNTSVFELNKLLQDSPTKVSLN